MQDWNTDSFTYPEIVQVSWDVGGGGVGKQSNAGIYKYILYMRNKHCNSSGTGIGMHLPQISEISHVCLVDGCVPHDVECESVECLDSLISWLIWFKRKTNTPVCVRNVNVQQQSLFSLLSHVSLY